MKSTVQIRDRRSTSWLWIDKAILLDTKLKYLQKLTYIALANFANNDNQTCFPSIATLKALSGLGRNSVLRSLDILENLGYISIERTEGDVNRYTLLDPTSVPEVLPPVSEGDGTSPSQGLPPVPHRDTNYTNINKTNLTKAGDVSFLQKYIDNFNQLFNTSYRTTTDRNTKIKVRLENYTEEEILKALDNLSQSEFHHGKNDRNWRADPDFLIRNDGQIDKWLNVVVIEKEVVDDVPPEHWERVKELQYIQSLKNGKKQ